MQGRNQKWTSAAAKRLLALAGNPESVDKAARIVASRLLDGIPCPPTDLEAIMPRLNVNQCEAHPDMPVNGELRKEGNALRIVYSSHLSPTRKRWTIAHELGHAVFESTGPGCPRYGKEVERLCDLLAREILLPKEQFLSLLERTTDLRVVSKLAKAFQTSLSATAIRCAELANVSVFEMQSHKLLWGYGIIRKGSHVEKDDEFKEAVARAMRGESGNQLVILRSNNQTARWLMEWQCIGSQKRALFLLRQILRNGPELSSSSMLQDNP